MTDYVTFFWVCIRISEQQWLWWRTLRLNWRKTTFLIRYFLFINISKFFCVGWEIQAPHPHTHTNVEHMIWWVKIYHLGEGAGRCCCWVSGLIWTQYAFFIFCPSFWEQLQAWRTGCGMLSFITSHLTLPFIRKTNFPVVCLQMQLTDFNKLFEKEVSQIKANPPSDINKNSLVRQFKEAVWVCFFSLFLSVEGFLPLPLLSPFSLVLLYRRKYLSRLFSYLSYGLAYFLCLKVVYYINILYMQWIMVFDSKDQGFKLRPQLRLCWDPWYCGNWKIADKCGRCDRNCSCDAVSETWKLWCCGHSCGCGLQFKTI